MLEALNVKATLNRPVLSHNNSISSHISSISQTYMIKSLVGGIQVTFGSAFSMSSLDIPVSFTF